MKTIRRHLIGIIVTASLLGGAAGAIAAAVSTTPVGTTAATAIEYTTNG
jgi:hypothetical protein